MRLSTFNRTKRAIDLAAVAATSPATLCLGVTTAMLVRRHLGSPVLFTQPRIGLDEREFEVIKFRTMANDRDADGNLLPDADRLTRFGRFLRSTSLDEIPQLLNIAKGEMSLVGPRPLFVRYLPHYTAEERQRHLVRPGITGLAQVSGRNSVAWEQRLAYDVEYVRRSSLRTDLRILLGTFWQVITRQNISVLASDSGEPLDIARSYPTEGSLALRRLRATDLETRVEWISEPKTLAYMQWPGGVTIESTRDWFERVRRLRDRIDYVAESDAQIVAMAGLRKTDDTTAELYVFVNPASHGEGWGGRVTSLVLQHGWQALGLAKIVLTVSRQNEAAIRIYDALGFVVTSQREDRVWMELVRT